MCEADSVSINHRFYSYLGSHTEGDVLLREKYWNDAKKLSSLVEGYRPTSSSTQTARFSPRNSDQSKKDQENYGENKISSVAMKKHQHLMQEPNESKHQCFVGGTTDKYHHQNCGNHYKHRSRNENPYENLTATKDIHQGSHETGPGNHGRHFYAKERHFCECSEDFRGNEESEQEDRGSFMNPDVNERTVAGEQMKYFFHYYPYPTGSVGVTLHEFQDPSLATSLEPSSLKPDDILRIIDGFAKQGIKPYKRELTVQEYKDVMRAVVRECYKKKILDGNRIKERVKECVETLRRGEPLSLGYRSSKRPEPPEHTELPVPTKRSKTDP
ncbi:unnamed protein product [Angiostrongylus costaricensis]|uniref:BEN domain-containing protein n=1 Tax=Angiostrongylus costaricensis TaxID=334426 RepID=A0A0R3PNK4_ANGCS|nr:unnamed protein product [Angiostrongylus costaricensis]